MGRFREEKNRYKEKRERFFRFFLMIIIAFLTVTQVSLSNSLSTCGEKITKLEIEAQKQSKENEELRKKISKGKSLAYLEEEAVKRGFIKLNNSISLTSPIPVAAKL